MCQIRSEETIINLVIKQRVLLNYQLVMLLLLRRASSHYILKSRLPKVNKLFAQVFFDRRVLQILQIAAIFDQSCEQNKKALKLKKHLNGENLNQCQKLKKIQVLNATNDFYETDNIFLLLTDTGIALSKTQRNMA